MARCPECGFPLVRVEESEPNAGTPLAWGYDETRAATAGTQIRSLAAEAAGVLRGASPERLHTRPATGVWSPLEYACHLRDVLLVQRERVLLVRRGHHGDTTPMGREERVDHDGYADQDPADVAVQLEQAALLFDGVLRRLGPADWGLTILYRYPEQARRSLCWVAVHTAHEATHHLHDLRQGLGKE